MNRSVLYAFWALVLGSLLIWGSSPWAQDGTLRPLKETAYVPGELLVKFRKETSQATINTIHAAMGSTVLKEYKAIGVHHIKLREGLTVEAARKEYSAYPEVVYAEPNYRYRTKASPSGHKVKDSGDYKVQTH